VGESSRENFWGNLQFGAGGNRGEFLLAATWVLRLTEQTTSRWSVEWGGNAFTASTKQRLEKKKFVKICKDAFQHIKDERKRHKKGIFLEKSSAVFSDHASYEERKLIADFEHGTTCPGKKTPLVLPGRLAHRVGGGKRLFGGRQPALGTA